MEIFYTDFKLKKCSPLSHMKKSDIDFEGLQTRYNEIVNTSIS